MLKNDPTLSEWAKWWLEVYVRPVAKPSGYEHYHDNLFKHILPALGKVKLSKLTTPKVQSFLNEEAAHGNLRDGGPLSTKSVKNMRVVLDVCCKRAVADGYMAANPVPATVYRHCSTKSVEVMEDHDQKVLEEWLFKDISILNAGIILGLYSGMRLGEVCALRWRHYNAANGYIFVEHTVRRITCFPENGKGKSAKRTELVISEAKTESSKRKLYLPEVLLDLVEYQYERYVELFGRMPEPDDFIIYNTKGGMMDPDNLSHYFGDVLEGLGLPHVKYHALRHTFATRAVENGVDVATVSGLLGHADVTTTTHYYVHPREEAMRRAMSAIAPVTQGYIGRRRSGIPNLAGGNSVAEIEKPARVCRRRKTVAASRGAVCGR